MVARDAKADAIGSMGSGSAPAERPLLPRGWPAMWLLGAMVLALAVRLYAFVGICRLDMFRYVEVSHHVLAGGSFFDPQVFFASARLPLILPVLAFNSIAGYGEHVTVAWPLLASVLTVGVAFLLGRELFDDATGAVFALLMAFFPLEAELGTQLLPDPIESLALLAALYLAVVAVHRDCHWRWAAIGSGVALVVAYQTRVNAAMFLVGVLVAGAALRPQRWRRSMWSLVGIAIGIVLFMGAFLALSGDPLADIHKAQQTYSEYQAAGFVPRADTFRHMFVTNRALVWAAPLGLIGLLGLVRRPSRAKWLLLAWAAAFFVYLDFASILHGLDSSYRYAEPMIPPILLLAAAAISENMLARPRIVQVATALLGGLLLLSMAQEATLIASSWRSSPRWAPLREVAEIAEKDPGSIVYVNDIYKLIAVGYYSGYGLGRDTLEPPEAPVNRKARLFTLSERRPRPGESAYVVTEVPAEAPAGASVEARFPFPGSPLKVYRVR